MESRLKFKVWDNVNKCWADLTGLAIDCQTGDLWCDWVDALCVNGESRDTKEFTIVQSTGLLDKNGVEIYEGDVVLRYDTNGKTRQMIVVWNQDGCGWSVKDEIYSMALSKLCKLEVVGNIYESPELVK